MWRWALLTLLLLAPLACAAGWVRSHLVQDVILISHDAGGVAPAFSRYYYLRSDAGVVALELEHTNLSWGLLGGSPKTRPAARPAWEVYFNRGLKVHNNYGDARHRGWGVPIGYRFALVYPPGFASGPLTQADAVGWNRSWWAPYWLVTLAAALPAMLLTRRLVRGARMQRRRARGQCAACAYDLRASSDRCPECGAAHVSNTPGNSEPDNAATHIGPTSPAGASQAEQ